MPNVAVGSGLTGQVLRHGISPGRLRLVIYSPLNAALGDGELARLSFTVKETAPFGSTSLALSAVVLGDANAAPVAPTELDGGSVEVLASADLAISKSDGVTTATPGSFLTYTVTATNAGPNDALSSTVIDTLPEVLTCTWTCTGNGGGTCNTSGFGSIDQTVDLPSDGSVTFILSCTVSLSATNLIVNAATVTAPAGVIDQAPGNDSAVDIDALPIVFVDGFETGNASRWSQQQPAALVPFASLAAEKEIAFGYDFASLQDEEALPPCPIAVAMDGAGKTVFAVETQRVDAAAPLELRLVGFDTKGDAHISAWQPVAERLQHVHLEWRISTNGDQGTTIALALDGRLALWLDGFSAPSEQPVSVTLFGPDPRRGGGDR